MPKKFYTEIDIENLAKQGVRTLELHNGIVLTDVAREKARALGVQLVQGAPAVATAPVATAAPAATAAPVASPQGSAALQGSTSDELTQRIRNAVKARLGDQVDPALLDTVIKRVLANTKLK